MQGKERPLPAYDSEFFHALESGVRRSASATVGLLIEICEPRSVVDVGCGTGLWLAALRERGVSEVLGIDGPWVPRELLAIPEDRFLGHDLTVPLELDREFELALCLETAEHLPATAAVGLVGSLTRLAPIVVFSAAVPGQGGHGHLNERWPSYWSGLFSDRGFQCVCSLRNGIWHSAEIEAWYRQNLLCFADVVRGGQLASRFAGPEYQAPLDVVHPGVLRYVREELDAKTAQAEQAKRKSDELRTELADLKRALRKAQRIHEEAKAELEQLRLDAEMLGADIGAGSAIRTRRRTGETRWG